MNIDAPQTIKMADQIHLTEYDKKPPACSSPIVQTINGHLYRVHDGHSYGRNQTVAPSKYMINQKE